MIVVHVLRIRETCIALQLLLLLLLPLLQAYPSSIVVKEIIVATTLDAENLAEALLCDGSGKFEISWHGNIMLSRTISVSNGSIVNVTGPSESAASVVSSDDPITLFEVDLGSHV